MKHYIIPPIQAYNARYRDYLYELTAEADTLIQRQEFSNPNYIVLNQTIRDDRGVSCENFYFNELKQLFYVIYDTGTQTINLFIRAHVLKYHRGLISKYGADHVYLIFNEVDTTHALPPESTDHKAEANAWYNKYVRQGKLSDSFWNSYLREGSLSQYSWLLTYPFKEGYVCFSNLLEEPLNSAARKDLSSYIIVPYIGSASYWMPDHNITDTTWNWTYIEDATSIDGTNCFFNWNTAPIRVYNHTDDNDGWQGPLDPDQHSYTFTNWDKINDNLQFNITTFNQTLWTGYSDDPICAIVINQSPSKSLQEVFVDNNIEYGSAIIDNSSKHYYTINMKKSVPVSDSNQSNGIVLW